MSKHLDTDLMPPPCIAGRFDIDRDGRWWHEGRLIARPELVTLFATVLRWTDEGYALVTPIERVPVQVADVPLRLIDADMTDAGRSTQNIVFLDNLQQRWPLNAEHLLVNLGDADHPRLYLHTHRGLWAALTRPVYYRLSEHLSPHADQFHLRSHGLWHRWA